MFKPVWPSRANFLYLGISDKSEKERKLLEEEIEKEIKKYEYWIDQNQKNKKQN